MEAQTTNKIIKLLQDNPTILFMKGDKYMPKCGFSKSVVEILNEIGVPYITFDILEDEEIRQGLKEFSNWPTYPQLYVNSELIGGCDIVNEMYINGELEQFTHVTFPL